jgi:sec-independent protein translocase protein TatC
MDSDKKYLPYLLELRKRAMQCFIVFFIVLSPLLFFSRELYTSVAQPILKSLPAGAMLICTQVMAPFTIPLKLSFFMSFAIIIPFILFHIWNFVAPALYPNEKQLCRTILLFSTSLFYSGIFFAHFIVLPMALHFLMHIAPQNVNVMTDITYYLDFILTLYFAFGMAFQVPIITFVLCRQGLISIDTLQKHRPFIIVGAFVVGMLLTPPDVISQILLAIPLWALFEIGFWMAKRHLLKSGKSIYKTT